MSGHTFKDYTSLWDGSSDLLGAVLFEKHGWVRNLMWITCASAVDFMKLYRLGEDVQSKFENVCHTLE